MKLIIATIAASAFALSAAPATAQQTGGMIIVHTLDQSREDAVAAVRDYTESHDDWVHLAEFDLAGGAATAVKVCYLPLGSDIVAAGLQVMAMMPCGHLAFYEKDGETRLSRLDLDFMTTLNPDENLARAVEAGGPAFATMLEETLGIDGGTM